MRVGKRAFALPALMMIALAMTGVAVAHWTDVIYIEGTAKMGSLTAGFDNIPPEVLPYIGWEIEPCTGDWARTTAWYEDRITDPHTGKSACRKLIIKVENAYPCYWAGVIFAIRNIGTVPLDISSYRFYDLDGKLTWVPGSAENGWFVDENKNKVIFIRIVNDLPIRIRPCSVNKMEIDVHFEQDARECHTYRFVVEVICRQC